MITSHERVRLREFVDDVKKDVIVCGVDEQQMQSSYLIINGEIYYAKMCISSLRYQGRYSHDNNVDKMRYIIDRYNESYNLFTIEHFKKMPSYRYCVVIRNKMIEYRDKYMREYKINKLINHG